MVEATVRLLIAQGYPVRRARTLADICAAFEAPEKPGPDPLGPRLYARENGRIYLIHGSGANKHRESTRMRVRKGEDYRKHPGALTYLANYVENLVQETLERVQAGSYTMGEVFCIYLTDHEPAEHDSDEAWDYYFDEEATCESLEEFMETTLFADLNVDVGLKYAKFRTGEQIKSQSIDIEDPEDVRLTKLVTARYHVDLLVKIVEYFAGKHNQPTKKIKKPKVPKKETLWLSADQWMRLLLAARGWTYDEDGRYIGYDRAMQERFAPIFRFIMLYTFGGTRHGSILELLWAMDLFRGHVDAARGEIKRQGKMSAVTNKRRGTSSLIGSLKHLAVGWCDDDATKRGKSLTRFTHVVHRNDGLPYPNSLRDLFNEVRERAGLYWVTPHHLKHTGVTFCAAAGMTQRQISLAFSTSMYTLEQTYTHLHDEWNKVNRTFKDSRLYLRNLRRLTALSAEEFYGGAVPLPPRRRAGRNRLPLAQPMSTKAQRQYLRRAASAR